MATAAFDDNYSKYAALELSDMFVNEREGNEFLEVLRNCIVAWDKWRIESNQFYGFRWHETSIY